MNRVRTHLSPPRKRGSRKAAAQVDSGLRGNDMGATFLQMAIMLEALRVVVVTIGAMLALA